MKRIWFIISFIFLLGFKSQGEVRLPDLKFKHLSTENGFPSNRVRDILQDPDGFMWFATDAGLVRFDGNRHKTFVPAFPGNEDEVFVMNLANHRKGLIVGTDHGLYGYDPVKETLAPLPLKYDGKIRDKISGTINSVIVDDNNYIWVAPGNNGVFRISPQGVVDEHYLFPESGDLISKLYVDNDGRVWATSNTDKGYVYKFDQNNSRFQNFQISLDGKEKMNMGGMALFNDANNDFWFGTWENGLIRFDSGTGEGKQYLSDNPSPLWHIHTINQYSPTQLLIGSDSGLLLLDINSEEYKIFVSDDMNRESMSGRFVYPITKDSEGGFWIGTFYRGVNYIGKDNGRFQKWVHSPFSNSVSGNVVSRICEDNKGNLWIGSADGGLCRYEPRSGIFTHYPLSSLTENDNINALCVDGDKLWVGTYGKGVRRLNINNGSYEKIPVEDDTHASCYAICKDSKGNIWIGATEHLALYNPAINRFEKISNLKAWINDIEEDNEGKLWISTQGAGLFRYDPFSKKWINFRADGKKGSLPHNHINNLLIDGDDIYVATPKGVALYDREGNSFREIINLPQGNGANAIQKSGDDLWISTNMGLICLKPDGEEKSFTINDGLCDNQFLSGSSCKTSDGKLYYGSVHGFNSVNPTEFRNKGNVPRLMFTGLDIVNEPVEVGDVHLPEALGHIDAIELSPDDHTFTIYFSAFSYSNPSSNKFKYSLEGFDKTWHFQDNEAKATYSNLPPGTYTFRLKGANSDNVWNDEGISMKIVVKPAWYATTFMKLLYLLLVLGFILLIVRFILWRMEKNHASELARISDNKEKEMFRSKLSFFTVVAHEIRTPVSLIIGPLEKVLHSKESFSKEVKEDLHVIDRNAQRLLSLVNQLLDYKKVENNNLPIGFRHQKIIPLLESIISRFLPSLEGKGIKLSVDFPDPDMEVDVDPEAITKLFSNLLNNAMKFTRDYIRVKCAPIEGSGKFEISVSDNGIGISKENQDKVFKPFYQVLDNINEAKGGTGLGLSIVKSVVEAHDGEIKLESTPGHGATFSVILPVKHSDTLPAFDPQALTNDSYENELMSPSDDITAEEDPVLLIVDDNEEMVKFINNHFENRYEVLTASNGKEAMEKMKEKTVSLIICDWMMPVMDGEEFLRAVRKDENYSHIPFVMLTAKTDNESKIESMKSGADAYVEKPFSISYLDARIQNLLEMRDLLKKKYSQSPLEPLNTVAQTQVDNELLTKLQMLIEENFSNPQLSVDFLADRLGISRSGLYAKIKTLADITPNELIQITRLKKAAELLSENKYRINEICYMVGFNSSSYFSRCFQKQFGMKPGEFAGKAH